MRFSGVSAQAIWAAATRSLTGFGSTALIIATTNGGAIAANSTVDARPSAGRVAIVELVVVTGAAGTIDLGLYDGTTFHRASSVASASTGGDSVMGNATLGPAVHNNDAANAGTLFLAGMHMAQ